MPEDNAVIATNALNKRQNLRRKIHKMALIFTLALPLWFMIAGLGSRFGLWSWQFGLGKMTRDWGPLILVLGLIVGVTCLLLALFIRPRKGVSVSAMSIVLPVLLLAGLISTKNKTDKLPFIHDITTDTQNPPEFTDAILSERALVENVNTVDYIGKMENDRDKKLVSVLQTRAYPDISTLVVSDPPDVVFGKAKAAAASLGWKIKSENVEAGLIEATDTTFWYGFEDDIVIRVAPSEGGGSVVDIRSVSRVGKSDIGANAKRIRAFLKIMRAA